MMESNRASVRRLVAAAIASLVLCGLIGCAAKQPPEPTPAVVAPPPAPPAPEPPKEEKIKKRYGKPYTVNGKTYRPLVSASSFAERGVASWYGADCHGKDTACGQPFDMFSVSAAHKILPLHTWVQVTNLENSQSLILQINDRGPFVAGRVIDLSYAAATSLGMTEKGVATVLVESLGSVPSPMPDKLKGTFYVQVGSFIIKDNARKMHSRMLDMGYAQSRMVKSAKKRAGHWRVQAGPFETLAAARKARSVLSAAYPSSFVLLAKSADRKDRQNRKLSFEERGDPLGAEEALSLGGSGLTIIEDADGASLSVDYEETAVAAYGEEGAEGEDLAAAQGSDAL